MMRDYANGYSAWRELDGIADRIKEAIIEKDEEECGVQIINALWIICNEHQHNNVFCAGDGEFLFDTEEKAEAMADVIDLAGGFQWSNTGYYDPEEDEREGCVDEFTGKWYASFD